MAHDAFVRGIATILWGSAWADHVEGHRCRSLSGCEITEVMPEIPELAWQLAERVAGRIEGKIGAWPVVFAAAMGAEHADAEHFDTDYHGKEAERFGECLCYAAQGAGVSWLDDHADFNLPSGGPNGGTLFSRLDLHGCGADEADMALAEHAAETCGQK